jgi:hypothetical protein
MSAGEPNGAENEVFEESSDERQSQSIQHIRANSSIMQMKKILGKLSASAGEAGE